VIVPFKMEHWDLLELRQHEAECLALDPVSRGKVAMLAQAGTGGTVFHDGRIIGVIGYIERWPGNFEVWAFPSIHVPKYQTVWLKTAKKYLRCVIRDFNPVRIQSPALCDDLHDRWMEFLEFTCESVPMKKYFPNGKSARMWGRVFE
jgi:hypothetical protein